MSSMTFFSHSLDQDLGDFLLLTVVPAKVKTVPSSKLLRFKDALVGTEMFSRIIFVQDAVADAIALYSVTVQGDSTIVAALAVSAIIEAIDSRQMLRFITANIMMFCFSRDGDFPTPVLKDFLANDSMTGCR